MRTSLILLTGLLASLATAAPKELPKAKVIARAPLIEVLEQPTASAEGPNGSLFLDFGKATFGNLELEFAAPLAAPADIIVHFGEKLAGAGKIDRNPGGTIRYQQVEAKVAAGAKSVKILPKWEPKHTNWIPNAEGMDEITPFRYVEIEGLASNKPKATRRTRQVAFDEKASHFSSSDPVLDAVWDMCKHTIRATTFVGLYVDGDRERKPYEADAWINQLCHYGVDAHYLTGRLTHEHLLVYPTWPMEWRQQAVLMAWADYLYSGDDASIRAHYDVLVQKLMLDRRREDGLFLGQEKGEPRDIIDWPVGERDGYDMKVMVKTVTSAFHAHSLQLMARMAKDIGKTEDASRFEKMAQVTIAAMREKLMDPARGIYIDGLDQKTGKPSAHASLHANMLPLALGLVAPQHVKSVADFVESRGMACSVYGAQFLLDGLYEAGRADAALALMNAKHDRSWHNMIQAGSTVALEAWDIKYKPNLDWNHAWGAVPANVIPRKLMGIEPLEPGFKRFRLRPQPGNLEHASIRAPSPKGAIEANFTRPQGAWKLECSVPAGTTAEVHLPAKSMEEITFTSEQKQSPKFLRMENGRVVAEAGPGKYSAMCPAAKK
ncbi:MAG: family 78 glycoside hydrolase catalytic domain [Verrucomicrobiales bacterium]